MTAHRPILSLLVFLCAPLALGAFEPDLDAVCHAESGVQMDLNGEVLVVTLKECTGPKLTVKTTGGEKTLGQHVDRLRFTARRTEARGDTQLMMLQRTIESAKDHTIAVKYRGSVGYWDFIDPKGLSIGLPVHGELSIVPASNR